MPTDDGTLVSTGLTYSWRGGDHWRHSARLSAKNLFDKEYLTPRASLGASRGVFLAYTLQH